MTYPGVRDPSTGDAGPAGADGRDYLTRSEERLHVSTERTVSGYVRLEKFVVTEQRTITVEVSHEEFRVVHQPLDGIDGGVPAATAGSTGQARPAPPAQQMNTARWMYVNREELVITKRVVPVERVRLEVYPVTEQRVITDQVRREQIEEVPPSR